MPRTEEKGDGDLWSEIDEAGASQTGCAPKLELGCEGMELGGFAAMELGRRLKTAAPWSLRRWLVRVEDPGEAADEAVGEAVAVVAR